MRQIKFRGKSLKTGEWFYGNLYDLDTHGRTHICTTYRGCLCIDPSTIGQFSGLLDRNGKEIYEGDVVDVISYYLTIPRSKEFERTRAVIEFVKDRASFFAKASGINFAMTYAYDMEVIGNIHDNPELMNRKQSKSLNDEKDTLQRSLRTHRSRAVRQKDADKEDC